MGRWLLGFGAVCFLVGAAVDSGHATPFVHEIAAGVGTGTSDGYYTSMALDAADRPHLAYYDFTNLDLHYVRKVGNAWVSEIVDSVGNVGLYCSIAVDAAGNPHIAYRDLTNFDLKYARKSAGIWTLEVAHSTGDVGSYCSLKIDAAGNPRIAYLDVTNLDLRYASKSGGIWTTEFVAGTGTNVGYYCSLALDATGLPHISYFDNSTDDLRYAVKLQTFWVTELVDATGFTSATSIACDDQGTPRIAYYDSTPGDLKYAAKINSLWTLETVDSVDFVGAFCSIQVNDAGNARISYTAHLTDVDLRYASRSTTTWTVETVDVVGDVGFYTSLALDSQGNPHIGYHDFTNQDVKYTSSAVRVTSPQGGAIWPVGSQREIAWTGSGLVSVVISSDGGLTEDILLESAHASPVTIRVPHVPSRFARVGVRRSSPISTSFSDSLLTIESSITLLSFAADASRGNGASAGASDAVELRWETRPGPADLAGYQMERASAGSENWIRLFDTSSQVTFTDQDATPDSRYRLFAVNGLGERYALGEVSAPVAEPIQAGPLPYRGGTMTVTFATSSGLGGGAAATEVALFDLQGRRVRTLFLGEVAAGRHESTWDGRDEAGQNVAPGIYFLKSVSGGNTAQLKIVVIDSRK